MAKEHTKEELVTALKIKHEAPFDSQYNNKVLAMYIDLHLSVRKYTKLQNYTSDMHGGTLYPSQESIDDTKNTCYPEHIDFSDSGAKVHIISLLDHTLKRILMTLNKDALQASNKNLIFLGKWGMDGSSGQQTTRQSFTNNTIIFNSSDSDTEINDPQYFTDASVFITTLVPLEVKTIDDEILWINKKPSSTFYCRTINFFFIKENDNITNKNYTNITKLLNKVQNYIIDFMDMKFTVKFDFKYTVIDGKAGNVLSNQKASSRCNICGVGPKNVNEIDHVLGLHCNTEFYKIGFPILHSWIRFMEYVLHISYNLDFKKGEARGSINKELKKIRKSEIQKLLRSELRITVDVVKQGSGTTNTGNVGRLFFAQSDEVSKIIGVNKEVLSRLYVVLQIISCKKIVNLELFKDYCLETAKRCVELYPWYKMPPSVHKILVHGCDIMMEFPKPIGYFSEEAQEATNKIFRKARAEHSRMFQRS